MGYISGKNLAHGPVSKIRVPKFVPVQSFLVRRPVISSLYRAPGNFHKLNHFFNFKRVFLMKQKISLENHFCSLGNFRVANFDR